MGVFIVYAGFVEPGKIGQVLGLRWRVASVEQIEKQVEKQVEAALPKASLAAVARRVSGATPDAAALMQRVIPAATFCRRSVPAGRDHRDLRVARIFGGAWIRDRRAALRVVPLVLARSEGNVPLSPQHPDFKKTAAVSSEPMAWDACLFEQ